MVGLGDLRSYAALSILAGTLLLIPLRLQAGEPGGLASVEVLLHHGERAVRGEFEAQAPLTSASAPPIELTPPSNDKPPTPQSKDQNQTDKSGQSDEKKEKKEDEKSDKKKDEKKEEAPKPKKWYDKYTLRGYAQLRINAHPWTAPGSAPPYHVNDRSVSPDENFLLRRARLVLTGDVTEHLSIYLQPDFVIQPPGSPDATHLAQIRDWYADIHLDRTKVHRFRVGQSKVPYGWENLQSSSNRLALDRNDAFNSATRNERDLGIFYYWTPEYAQRLFKYVLDQNLRGSGNYGVLGVGVYNGQGGSLEEQNEGVHTVVRVQIPYQFRSGQVIEVGMQGYWGRYTVLGTPIRPLGVGAPITPAGVGGQGHLDQRLGWTAIVYPQPLGVQAEWTIGRGPALNAAQTAITDQFLHGGYVQTMLKLDHCRWGTFFPFVRWQMFRGGYKSERNAPYSQIDEWELGLEWQLSNALKFTSIYTFTDRTNTAAPANQPLGVVPYRQYVGQLMRFQLQVSY